MSLRRRLVAMFVLVAAVLLGTDVAVGLMVHHSLVTTLDRRLEVGRAGTRTVFGGRSAGGPLGPDQPAPATEPPSRTAVSDLYVALIGADGSVQQRNANTIGRNTRPPVLTAQLASRAAPAGTTPRPFTLASEGGGPGYRAVALRTARGPTVVVAVSLRDTTDTLHSVLLVEVLASLLVLLAFAAGAWWVLHLGLRPLDEMAETADAIAAGDLSLRVERADERTEAGRLGIAFNTMLTQIEQSFAERSVAEERLRRFVADASHELRTPLTSIRGYAELFRQGGLDGAAALTDAMRRMEQEAARMGVLVDDMLLLARLDQGRPLEAKEVDLAVLTADAVADAHAVQPGRPIAYSGPDHLPITGDEARLREVLANLLSNAATHTPSDTPVRVSLASAGGFATLVVEDDGPGLGPEPDRVFERFYRADPARTRASGGAGLGLAIVAAVVAAHGGHASAGPSESGGARLTVAIPCGPWSPSGEAAAEQAPQFT